jgi:hypothetical protein
MSNKSKKKDHDDHNDQNGQGQGQAQGQANLQAQLQGQGQGQGQLQGQGQAQGQAQFAVQGVYQESENKNDNDNKNENDNKVDNNIDNKLDNKVDNDVENKVENSVDNKVDVEVKVDVDLGIEGLMPSDNDLIDIDDVDLSNLDGAFIAMTDDVMQDVHGMGNDNAFNIDQVNSLVDNDKIDSATVSYGGGGGGGNHGDKFDLWGGQKDDAGGFSQWASADGGDAKVDDIKSDIGHDGNVANATSADAIINQEAFTQNIVMGANIQFNSIDLTTVGNNLTSTSDTSDVTDAI